MTEQEIDDFFDGQRDCQEGEQADPNRSDYYTRGYAAQYELEQVRNELTKTRTEYEYL